MWWNNYIQQFYLALDCIHTDNNCKSCHIERSRDVSPSYIIIIIKLLRLSKVK